MNHHVSVIWNSTLVRKLTASACLVIAILMPSMTFAVTPADIQAAQRQLDNIQREEQERIQRDQEAARSKAEHIEGMDTRGLYPKIGESPLDAPCSEISEITINGAPNLASSERERIIGEFLGRCLNVGDIERILSEITKYYIDHGYITTRAYLPAQDLNNGHLEILVIEGVVDKILINDGDAKSISVANIFPGIEGDLLNLRDLEQGIDQINRLASNNARLDIQPGEKTGASTVVVHNTPSSPFHFNLSADNQGSESTGKKQGAVTASVDHLLGFNEMFSITHRESLPNDSDYKGSESDNLNFSIPFGYTSISVGLSRSRYSSPLNLPSGLQLVSSGTSENQNIRLDRVMFRGQKTRATLAATLTTKSSKNYLDGQFLAVSSRRLTVLDLDGDISTGFLGGAMTFTLGYARGLSIMGASKDLANLPYWAPRSQFGKVKVGFNYARPFQMFGKNASFTSQLTGQKAQTTLHGSEQISIGGLYSVRGFVRNTLAGDDGYYLRSELSVREPVVIGSAVIGSRFYIGYDTGEVWNRAEGVPSGRLAGMVLGLSANWRGATFDLFNARPLTLASNMIKESSQTWFRLAYSF